MELNLHQLEIFLCIARERSFSKAAERLRISQPSEVDLGVIEGDPAATLLTKEPWYTDELVLVVSPRSHLLKKRRLFVKEVLEEPFLIQSQGIRPTFIERVFAERGMFIKNRITVGSREAVKTAVAAGCGVSIMPKSLIDTEQRAGVLKARKIHDLDVRYPVNLIYRRDKQLSKSVLAFAELLKKQTMKSNVLPFSRSSRKEKPRLVS